MAQSTAYSGNYAHACKGNQDEADYVIDVSLTVLESIGLTYAYAQQPHHQDVDEHQIPVVQESLEYDSGYLSAALIAEFRQHLERAAASGIREIDRVDQVGHDTGRCHHHQQDLGQGVIPLFLLEMEREHHEHHVECTQIHDAGGIEHQSSLGHGPDHAAHIGHK